MLLHIGICFKIHSLCFWEFQNQLDEKNKQDLAISCYGYRMKPMHLFHISLWNKEEQTVTPESILQDKSNNLFCLYELLALPELKCI